jgi:two-component system, NtrC family, response regulator AtoC
MSQALLLVDDDPTILLAVGRYLERLGYEVLTEGTGAGALAAYQDRRPEMVLLDLYLPDAHEFSVLEALRTRNASVVVLTGRGDIDTAVRAMQLGAENFLTKPVDLEHLGAVIARGVEKNRILRENERLRERDRGGGRLEALGSSPAMRELAEKVELLARSDRTTVLLTGESGTGKGWVARMLHGLSPRSRSPFVEVNSAGLTATFLASELFGHEKGAFTDARERRDGLFLEADGGTLLLDEVGDLGVELQPRLLHVLETRTFRRMGGNREITVDVRLVAATNRNLQGAVDRGEFREDLFYRLKVAPLHLPPLRERNAEDRLGMLHHLLAQLGHEIAGSAPAIADDAVEMLLDYPWPGNIREMRNVLERALIYARGAGELTARHLPTEVRQGSGGPARDRGRFEPEALEAVQRRHVERVLIHHRGNRTRAARDLGIARTTLIQKIQRWELDL